jgi:hypothetical protein
VSLSPEQADRVSLLLEQQFCSEADLYEDGKCPELALALTSVLPGSKLCVGVRQWQDWSGVSQNPLSHVVVSCGPWEFDARGNWASLRWEERWEGDYSEKPDENVSFRWQTVSKAALLRRVKTARAEDPEIDWELVDKLGQTLHRLLNPCLSEARQTSNFSPSP